MARKKKKSSRRFAGVDPAYLERQRESLRRVHRKTVLFNAKELEAIDAYCKRFKVASRSALIRRSVMAQVLAGLEESHPKLF